MLKVLLIIGFISTPCIFSSYNKEYECPLISEQKQPRGWTSEQDSQLKQAIANHGDNFWKLIANDVQGKNSKQCRERYLNHLDPTVNKSPFSEEEITLLHEAVKEFGHQWDNIAKKYFSCTITGGLKRTNLQLKNCWAKLQKSALSIHENQELLQHNSNDGHNGDDQEFNTVVQSIDWGLSADLPDGCCSSPLTLPSDELVTK